MSNNKKEIRNQSDSIAKSSNAQYDQFTNDTTNARNQSDSNSKALRNNLLNIYGGAGGGSMGSAPSNGMRPNVGGNMDARTRGGMPSIGDAIPRNGALPTQPDTGGPNRPQELNTFMGDVKPNSKGWYDLPDDGGFQGAAGGDYGKSKEGYSKFADTGGKEDFAEAEGGYRQFANTGGVDATALRHRATAVIPNFFSNYKNQAAKRANTQGGYSPGFDQQQAEMGRMAGREGFAASRQVEGDIADKTQQGMEFGISGLGNIAGQVSGNKLTGLAGLKGIGDSEQSNNQYNAGLNESRNARNLSAQMHLNDNAQSGRIESARGIQGVFANDRTDTANANTNILQSLQGKSASELEALRIKLGAKGDGVPWRQIIAGAAGIGVGAFGGPAAGLAAYGAVNRA